MQIKMNTPLVNEALELNRKAYIGSEQTRNAMLILRMSDSEEDIKLIIEALNEVIIEGEIVSI